ncbi:MAG: putative metal-binding motif-containing protein [bacterium]
MKKEVNTFLVLILLCMLFLCQACNNNGAKTIWYKDEDRDFFSDGTSVTSTDQPSSDYYKQSELIMASGDCNDNDDTIYPGADEICDDGKDNDCDGDIDCVDSDCDCVLPPLPLSGKWDSMIWGTDKWGE